MSSAPGQSETELVAFRDWTVRVRRAAGVPARLMLLVHGWTGDENSMWVFARNLPPRYWLAAPRGPYPTEPSGYSWQASHGGHSERPTLTDLEPAVEAVMTFVDEYGREYSLDVSQFDAMGFSQGAALVSALALLHPDRVGRFGVLAGFVPAGAEKLAEDRPLAGKDCFVAHGTLDDRVDIDLARRSVKILDRAGANVTYCEDEVGHKLSLRCLHSLEAFFS